jgi:hypothetical protein
MSLTRMDAPFRFLDVKVVRSTHDRSQFAWQVFERDGTLLQCSTQSYSDERAALRDGNAAARNIRRAGTNLTDLRSAPRKRSILGARIVFHRRNSTLDCVVRDISATGANLILAGAGILPSEFNLEIPIKGQTLSAKVVWHKGNACGVRFVV